MATQASPAVSASDRLAHQQRLQMALHVLRGPGWDERLAPW
jgi:hypothetical protein